MKLTRREVLFFNRCLADLKRDPAVQSMRRFRKHGRTDTYHHCERVAFYSFWLARRCAPLWEDLGFRIDYRALVRGAFLHDFYLYDWHEQEVPHKMHALVHPALALKNASEHFSITPREADIIRNHMWPLTLANYPRSIEAFLVTLTDKASSVGETFLCCGKRAARDAIHRATCAQMSR